MVGAVCLQDDVVVLFCPSVHVGAEAAVLADGLGQGEAVDDEVHMAAVGRLVHLSGHVERVIPSVIQV